MVSHDSLIHEKRISEQIRKEEIDLRRFGYYDNLILRARTLVDVLKDDYEVPKERWNEFLIDEDEFKFRRYVPNIQMKDRKNWNRSEKILR
jgi:hypothetical protein